MRPTPIHIYQEKLTRKLSLILLAVPIWRKEFWSSLLRSHTYTCKETMKFKGASSFYPLLARETAGVTTVSTYNIYQELLRKILFELLASILELSGPKVQKLSSRKPRQNAFAEELLRRDSNPGPPS